MGIAFFKLMVHGISEVIYDHNVASFTLDYQVKGYPRMRNKTFNLVRPHEMEVEYWENVLVTITILNKCIGWVTPITLTEDAWDFGINIDELTDEEHPALRELKAISDGLLTFSDFMVEWLYSPDKLSFRLAEGLHGHNWNQSKTYKEVVNY